MKNIKFFAMDVDGTLTDGKIYMSDKGECFKAFNIKDGYAIHSILREYRMIPVIITGRKSQIVEKRAQELNIDEIHQGVSDKLTKLKEIILRYPGEADLSSVAYIGDDLNDIPTMNAVQESGGLVGCPADAVKQVLERADYIAQHNGGDGAVRDFIEWIVE